jgi:pilus assembly protein Flp/PilA
MEIIRRLVREEEGQGLVEYALIIALISLVLVTVGPWITEAVGTQFSAIAKSLSGASTTAPTQVK